MLGEHERHNHLGALQNKKIELKLLQRIEEFQFNLNLYEKRELTNFSYTIFLDSFVQMNSIDFSKIVESFLIFLEDEGSYLLTN